MHKLRHVIWDWNGTLLNDLLISHNVLNEILKRYSLPAISLDYFQKIYRHPIIEMYEQLGFDFREISFEVVSGEWHDLYIEQSNKASLHTDAIPTLEKLQNRGITQSILSALPHNILLQHIEKFNIQDYFLHVSGLANSSGGSKIENGKNLIKRINLPYENVVIIGDSTHDLETATALGIKHFLVTRGHEHRDRLARHDCVLFDNFEELLSELGV